MSVECKAVGTEFMAKRLLIMALVAVQCASWSGGFAVFMPRCGWLGVHLRGRNRASATKKMRGTRAAIVIARASTMTMTIPATCTGRNWRAPPVIAPTCRSPSRRRLRLSPSRSRRAASICIMLRQNPGILSQCPRPLPHLQKSRKPISAIARHFQGALNPPCLHPRRAALLGASQRVEDAKILHAR